MIGAGDSGMATRTGAQGRLGLLERFPTRLAVQWVLGVVIGVGVLIGTWETLSLSQAEGGLTATQWEQLVFFGIAQGAIYALIALGYSLVYGILRMINFAHGEIFMAGAYGSYFVARTLDETGFLNRNPIVTLVILLVVAMATSSVIAALLERIAYRPLRNSPRLVPLITAIGASLFLQNAFKGFFGPQTQAYPVPDVLGGDQTWTILGITMQRIQVVVIVTAIVAVIGLTLFISRTRTGRSIRAVAEDREIASLMGIDVDRTIMITFALGGLLAGIAGVQFGLTFGQVSPYIGFTPGIAAFTASVLGGIGSIGGAALGGLLLGLLQAVGPPLLFTGFNIPAPFQLQDVITFSVLVLVLIFRHGGILGSGEAEKV